MRQPLRAMGFAALNPSYAVCDYQEGAAMLRGLGAGAALL
jgi:hypothetical protein